MLKKYLTKKSLATIFALFISNIFSFSFAEINFQLPVKYPVLYVDFKQERIIHGLTKPIVSEGSMIVYENEGLFWNQATPFAMTLLLTETKMVNQVKNGKKEIISAKDNPALFQFNHLLSALFSMDTDLIAQYFKIQSVQKKGQTDIITLKPISSPIDKIFGEIVLNINQDIQKVTLVDLQGDSTHLYFNNHDGRNSLKAEDVEIFK